MAKADRLEPYTDFEMIDNIVVHSGGAYTHETVFQMSLDFTYKLTLFQYERAMYKQREIMISQEINKTK